MNNITPEQLKVILNYDPETGVFIWLTSKGRRVKAGDIAGSIEAEGYRVIRIDKKLYKAHRIAWLYMTGSWPKNQIDHINHIRDDNRWANFKEATNQENQRNASLRKDNVSGVAGVCWSKADRMWRARIRNKSERVYLGRFADKFEAICARLSANNKYGYHENHGR